MDHDKVMEFLGRFVTDLGATGAAGQVAIGNRLGPLPRARRRARRRPSGSPSATGCHPRYLTEWLRGQAAGGYVSYDPATGEFSLTEEQAFCLADPERPEPVRGVPGRPGLPAGRAAAHRGVPHR